MCGILGIIGNKDASRLTYLGLYSLQHRGEESAGITSFNGRKLLSRQGMGLISDVCDEKDIKFLKGNAAIGHVRYSTTGSSHLKNVQPFCIDCKKGKVAIAHNGNITNTLGLRDQLETQGAIFQTSMDSEIVAHLIAHSPQKNLRENLTWSLSQVDGAYSLVMLLNDCLVGARDPYGFRPLCLGKFDGSYVLASETCALDLIQATYIRDIEPGEIVFIQNGKIDSIMPFAARKHSLCIFEYIYFARPDSNIFGNNVYMARRALGENLAREYPVDADLVMPVPDSGIFAALGFARQSKIQFEMGMIRNHYIGRTFIQPSQFIRDFRVKIKLNPVKDILKGKRVVVVEDSIVRGTTSRARVKNIRDAGARQVHMRVSCPPLKFPCFYGIDFPTKKELIASKYSLEKIRDFIRLDSLEYLSLEGMLKSMQQKREEFCTACFSGEYPTHLAKRPKKTILEER
ncbi:MAG: amidophosphoribosyltransferase [Candidatus Omnitrophota bacterium]